MLRSAITAVLLAALPAGALAGPEAEAVITEIAEDFAHGQTQTTALIEQIDTGAIAHFVLGRHSKSLSEADRLRFRTAFQQYLTDTIREESGRFAQAQVDILGSLDRNPRDSVVQSRVSDKSGNTTMVRWRLTKRGDAWRIVDLQIEGLWLAIELRAQISAILGNPGADIDEAILGLHRPGPEASAS